MVPDRFRRETFALSNREVMSVQFGPRRGITNALTFATLLVVTALAMQWLNVSAPVQNGVVRRPILLRMMDAPAPEPSAYDVEHSMGPKALVARWDSMMDEASQALPCAQGLDHAP